ncbi:MAG TPA: Yip1 family protein [Gemmatimonadales bacterium]|nr:Yip1 family protein [Gemmatimonadales bacterium]
MNLVERVKRILLSPKTEWEVIDAERTSIQELYTRYIMPLAAIGPIAQLIGTTVFGVPLPFVGTYRVPIGSAITQAIVGYLLSLAGTYVLALIIDALAPTFSARRSQIEALKVAAYSMTASWLAGIFGLIPALSILGLLGLYSLYLLYLGLPVLMRAPREKAAAYSAVVIIIGIVLWMVIAAIAAMFLSIPGAGRAVP